MKRNNFTLTELLVVMAIIGVLAGLVLGVMPLVNDKNAEAKIRSQMKSLEAAFESYKTSWGYYPIQATADTVSQTLFDSIENKDTGRHLVEEHSIFEFENDNMIDAYGGEYQYKYPGTQNKQSYDLWCPGKDDTLNTADDFNNWSKD